MPPIEDTVSPPLISTARSRAARLPVALVMTLAACGAPEGPAFEPAPETRAAPRPALIETERLRVRLEGAESEAERLAAGSAALEARAEGLRARAEALGGPVVDPERRPRLLEAGGGDAGAP